MNVLQMDDVQLNAITLAILEEIAIRMLQVGEIDRGEQAALRQFVPRCARLRAAMVVRESKEAVAQVKRETNKSPKLNFNV